MLFPLSKTFCASSIFQRGGEHHEAPKQRMWTVDNSNVVSKTSDLHKLLASKRPYEHHLQLARTYSEPARLALRENSKRHAQSIIDLNRRMEDQARVERVAMQRRIREFGEARESNDAAFVAKLRGQSKDYLAWREEMSKRVGAVPALGSEGVPRESAERIQQREDQRRAVGIEARRYIEEQHRMQEKLSSVIEVVRVDRRGEEEALESRKAAKAAAMRRDFLDHEGSVEDMYGKHDERIKRVQQAHRERHAERCQRLKEKDLDNTMEFKRKAMSDRKEIDELTQRINSRARSFGGYQPFLKSDKRLRDELAQTIDRNMTSSAAHASAAGGGERTLSPRSYDQHGDC